ncbi:hypothetical protein MOVS_07110 [Moraxella ovis]|uniref:Haemagglutinin n=1 Tax=Moraxella ovis TaxID=29433 RepID=A0A378PRB1_9GAMM|nr:ESPR-type extended signal peptide-containing protein [Moraxella ovis]ANB91781.1 hypothetical protein MOVS_07110 [Moraxella ovis]STY87479.1 Haemagglutinin [Moraxella ovis]
MNSIYKIVFNKATGTYQAVAEFAKSHTRAGGVVGSKSASRSRSILAALPLSLLALSVGEAMANNGSLEKYIKININGSNMSDAAAQNGKAIAVGPNAKANAPNTVVIGADATAGEQYDAVIIGAGAKSGKLGRGNYVYYYHYHYENPLSTYPVVSKIGDAGFLGEISKTSESSDQKVTSSVVAIGTNTEAKGGGVAVGHGAMSTVGEGKRGLGVAVGAASRSIDGGVAIGPATEAVGLNTVAVGRQAVANGKASQAYGATSAAEGVKTIAMGQSAHAKGDRSIAIGASGGNSTEKYDAITNTMAEAEDSIAFGTHTRTGRGANKAIAIGKNTEVARNAISGVAIGDTAKTSKTNGIALGNTAKAEGVTSTAIGTTAKASRFGAQAIGFVATADGLGSQAIGMASKANKRAATALGFGAVADGIGSQAIGAHAIAKGLHTQAIGADARALAANATAVGHLASAKGESAAAFGHMAKADKRHATATGAFAKAQAKDATALGAHAQVTKIADHGSALGAFSRVTTKDGVALGAHSLADRKHLESARVAIAAEGAKAKDNQVYSPLLPYMIENTKLNGLEGDKQRKLKAFNEGIENTVKGEYGAVSVGTSNGTRQIINVAAGSEDSDAVNVAQLKALAGTPIIFEADQNGKVIVNLGDRLPLKGKENGGITTSADLKTNGLTIEVKPDSMKGVEVGAGGVAVKIDTDKGVKFGGDGKIEVNLAPNKGLEFDQANGNGKGIAVKAGDGIEVNAKGVNAKPNKAKGVTVDDQGIAVNIHDEGGLKFEGDQGISIKLKDGDNPLFVDGDGLTLKHDNSLEVKGDELSVKLKDKGGIINNGQGLEIDPDNTTVQIKDGKVSAKTTTLTPNQGTGKIEAPNGGNENALVTAGDIAKAINQSGFTLKNSASTGGLSVGSSELIKPGDEVTMQAGKNIMIAQAGGLIDIATKDRVEFLEVQLGYGQTGPRLTDDGEGNLWISNSHGGAAKIGNVARGEFDDEAVNVEQLTEAQAKYFADEDSTPPQGEDETTVGATAATSKEFAKSVDNGVIGIKGGKTGDNDEDKNITTTINTADNTLQVALNPDVKGLTSIQFAEGEGVKVGDDVTFATENATAVGRGAVAFGEDTSAFGNSALAIAPGAQAVGARAKAWGIDAQALGPNAQALANNAQAIGANSRVIVDGGVALGAYSIADRVVTQDPITYNQNANVEFGEVYTPVPDGVSSPAAQLANQAIKDTVKGTLGAVSVGDDENTRQIINVAAGSEDTDAVNVAQLRALSELPMSFNADFGDAIERRLGETLTIHGRDNSVYTVTNGQDKAIEIGVRANEAMGVQITPGGVAVKLEKDANNPLQFGNKGGLELKVDANTLAVDNNTNVLGGDKKLKVKLADKGGITTKTDGDKNSNGLKVDVDNTTVQINEAGKVAAKTTTLTPNQGTGKIDAPNEGDKNALITAGDVANAINNSGFTLQANGKDGKLVKAGDKVNFIDGNFTNVTLEAGENGQANTIKVDVNAQGVVEKAQLPVVYTDAAGNKLTLKNGKFIGKDGKEVDPADVIVSINNGKGSTTQPTNLANVAGSLAPTYNVGDMIVGPNGRLTTNPIFDATKEQAAPQGQQLANIYNNAATVGDVLNAGFNLQANGKAADFVKAYDTVNFVNGAGTTAVVDTDGKTSTIKYDVNVDGDTITTKTDPNDPTKTVITANTTPLADADNDGKVDAPTAPNALVTANTVADAINNSGFTLKANGEAGKLIKAGDTISINQGDNIKVTQDENGNLTVATKQDVAFETVKVGDTLKVGDVIINQDGINAGNQKVTNVADGNISKGSKDAVNGGQIYQLKADLTKGINAAKTEVEGEGFAEVTSKVGSNGQTIYTVNVAKAAPATVDASGKLNIQGADGNKVLSAADTINAINNSGFTLKANGEDGKLVKAGDAVSINQGNNTRVFQDDNGNIVVETKDDVAFETVKVGDVLKVGNITITPDGISAAGTKVTNVADGTNNQDAVNVSQLNKAKAAATTEVKAGNNVSIDSTKGAQGQDIYTISAKDRSAKVVAKAQGLIAVETGDTTDIDGAQTTSYTVDLTDKAKEDIAKGVKALNKVDSQGLTFKADNGSTDARKLGDTLNVKGDNKNITTKAAGDAIEVQLKSDITVDSVTAGNSKLDTTGLTINAATPANTVSLTAQGLNNGGQRITNVAPGVKNTDAVNVSQLKGITQNIYNDINYANNRIGQVDREAKAGIASAMAFEEAPFVPGKWTYAVGAAHYGGEQAVAATLRKTADNGRWAFSGGISAASEGDTGFRIGVSGVID